MYENIYIKKTPQYYRRSEQLKTAKCHISAIKMHLDTNYTKYCNIIAQIRSLSA
jgi:hypothetical protein